MNAIVTIEPAPTAGPHGKGHTIFSARAQADFLAHLQLFGNVRSACRAARVSSQTAYRQRRASPALARAWDAALLAARAHAEQVLADRAIEGVEEAVFYHGEEVARRRRYSDRLLLAHLARLDRLEERAEIAATLPLLDGQIDALRRGETLPEDLPPDLRQEGAPSAPSCGHGADAFQHAGDPAEAEGADAVEVLNRLHERWPDGSHEHRIPPPGYPEWEADMDDPDHWENGSYIPPHARALDAMHAARPGNAEPLQRQGSDPWAIEALQLEAFVAGADAWWQVTTPEELEAALVAAEVSAGGGAGKAPRSARGEGGDAANMR